MKNTRTSYRPDKKVLVAALAVALVAVLGLVIVFAYLSGKAPEPVKNTLTSEQDPQPGIDETVDEGKTVKTDVSVDIPNVDYDVYVRAAIVATWVKLDDNNGVDGAANNVLSVHSNQPKLGTDYTLTLANFYDGEVSGLLPDTWTLGSDGFYYYSSPVLKQTTGEGSSASSSRTTLPLIASCSIKDGANVPEGYTLSVEIVAQVIQAIGTTDAGSYDAGTLAVVDAWKVTTVDYTAQEGNEPIVLIHKGLAANTGLDDPDADPITGLPDDDTDDTTLP